MKKILLYILFSAPLALFSQDAATFPVDSLTNKVVYTAVVTTKGNKSDLYLKAKEWFAKTFVSANHVIQMDDKEAGKIIGKGLNREFYTVMMTPVQHEINYTISVQVKDDKYKYEISSIIDEQGTSRISYPLEDLLEMVKKNKSGSSTIKKKVLPQIDNSIKNLIASLNSAMSAKVAKNDDF